MRALKTFGAWLEREGYTPSPSAHGAACRRLDQKQLVPLSEEERRLLNTYNDNSPGDCRTKAIFLLMLDTRLCLAEVIAFQTANVDLDHGFLLVMGKGRKERSVPFGFTTEKVLRKYVTFFRPDPANARTDELFLSPEGYPLTQKGLEMMFAQAAQTRGITRLHAHLLRHTYGIRAQ